MTFWEILLAWCVVSIVFSPLIARFIEAGKGGEDE